MRCRHCATPLEHTFLNLGFAPPSNAYLRRAALSQPELYLPLHVKVCHSCWLVQTEDYVEAENLFESDYAYFSSTSTGWLAHARTYSERMFAELNLDAESFVVEVASNDGYLLKNFVAAKIPCLGIEPTDSTAAAAEALGIPVTREFFGEQLAVEIVDQYGKADLIVGNNVYAHVPDINNFTRGLAQLLKPGGTVTLEFPHLLPLIELCQFDTVYHEHFSYLSLLAVQSIFGKAGLRAYRVETLQSHGGSLRVFACHHEAAIATQASVSDTLAMERARGLDELAVYRSFQASADAIKNQLLTFLLRVNRTSASIAAYGAAAKGNTLLNYAGVKPDLLPFVCDAAKSKQGKFLPGSHIPILEPAALFEAKPDYVLILPWNLKEELIAELQSKLPGETCFVTVIPEIVYTPSS